MLLIKCEKTRGTGTKIGDMFTHCSSVFSVLLPVHIVIRSELRPRIDTDSHAEKSNISSSSGTKTCSVGAAFVFKSDQILLLLRASAETAQQGIWKAELTC